VVSGNFDIRGLALSAKPLALDTNGGPGHVLVVT